MNASGKSMPSIRSNAEWIESYWRPLERKLVQLGGDSASDPDPILMPAPPKPNPLKGGELWVRNGFGTLSSSKNHQKQLGPV